MCCCSFPVDAYRAQVCRTRLRVPRLRLRTQLAQRADRVVGRGRAGENEAQGEQRLVGRFGAHLLERTIERLRAGLGRPGGQCVGDRLRFAGAVIEEVAVEGMQVHPMRFALWGALLCATIAATPGVHLRGSASGIIEGRPVVVTDDRDGERELVRTCSSAVCEGTWYDGQRRWWFGINEVLLPDERTNLESPLLARARAAAVPVSEPLTAPTGPGFSLSGDASLRLTGDPVPVVPCTLAGRRMRCLLDSGTTPSLVTLQVAEQLGLEPRGAIEIVGFAPVTTGIVTAGPLTVGPARYERVSLAVVPRSEAVAFDVVVGADLLAKVELVLDRAHRVARLLAPGTQAPSQPIPLRFRSGVPVAPVQLGPAAGEALVDTGDSAILSEGYAAYREGPQWPVVGHTVAQGLGGTDDVLEIELPNAAIGSLQLGPTRALVRRTQRETHVGIGLWNRCAISLDESNAQMGC